MNDLISSGLLMYTFDKDELKVFLVHPGGPFFKNKDDGYWSIPKGLAENEEDLLRTAVREFKEETGIEPVGEFDSLGWVKQKSGKTIYAWSFEYFGDCGIKILSNKFELEWPPNSGQKQFIPEIDDGRFFSIKEARLKINGAQAEFLDVLQKKLNVK
jgi:predicted NUDIX family NTP pyrophosphohydrolase